MPILPTHYLRAVHFVGLDPEKGMQFGFNYVGRKTDIDGAMRLFGLDWTTKFRESSQLRWFVQSEIWLRLMNSTQELGEYVSINYLIPDSNWELGLRLDGWSDFGLANSDGSSVSNFRFGVVPQVTFRASEFVQLRATLETDFQALRGSLETKNIMAQIQAVFLLGAHPAHEF